MALLGRGFIALMIVSFDIINTVKAPDSLPKSVPGAELGKRQV
jgi:hypothetical protein